MMWREAVAILCFVAGVSSINLKIISDSVDKSVSENDQVVFNCSVRHPNFDMYGHLPNFLKVLPNGERKMIGTPSHIDTTFKETNRYKVTIRATMTGAKQVGVDAELKITNIKLADNGTYSCKVSDLMTNENVESAYVLLVKVPVKELKLQASETLKSDKGNKYYDFNTDKKVNITCSTYGGNPSPLVSILIGDRNVTGEFTVRRMNVITGKPGLEEVVPNITLTVENYKINKDDRDKEMKCVANNNYPGKTLTEKFLMKVEYPPTFKCDGARGAPENTRNYTLDCMLESNPEIEASNVTWVIGNTTFLRHGIRRDGFTMKATVDKVNRSVIYTSLMIDVVNMSSYQTYLVRAGNKWGQREKQITLYSPENLQAAKILESAILVSKLPPSSSTKRGGAVNVVIATFMLLTFLQPFYP